MSAAEFFSMGGRGLYVWSAYGAFALALLAEGVAVARRARAARRAVEERMADEAAAQESRP